MKTLQATVTSPLGRLLHFVGANDYIPGLLGLFRYTGLRIHFFSWQWLGEGNKKLYL
jgi:hypothetical protein